VSLRFPGPAEPARAPLRWAAFTTPTPTVAFPGDASPGRASLRWEAWTGAPPAGPRTSPETQIGRASCRERV
jgi:hypothetical protein